MCPHGSADPEKDMTQDRSANGQQLKIVIVGDGGCGKTSLLMVYAKGDFPEVKTTHTFLPHGFTLTRILCTMKCVNRAHHRREIHGSVMPSLQF